MLALGSEGVIWVALRSCQMRHLGFTRCILLWVDSRSELFPSLFTIPKLGRKMWNYWWNPGSRWIWPPSFWMVWLAPRLHFERDPWIWTQENAYFGLTQHLLYLKSVIRSTRRGSGDLLQIGSFKFVSAVHFFKRSESGQGNLKFPL